MRDAFEALRKQEKYRAHCPREPQFERMYALAGDKKAQAEIRGPNHCTVLKDNPFGCDDLLGDGRPCPHNAYKVGDKAPALQRYLRLERLASFGIYQHERLRLGLLPLPVSPVLEQLLIEAAAWQRELSEKQQAAYLAEFLAPLFGGAKE